MGCEEGGEGWGVRGIFGTTAEATTGTRANLLGDVITLIVMTGMRAFSRGTTGHVYYKLNIVADYV